MSTAARLVRSALDTAGSNPTKRISILGQHLQSDIPLPPERRQNAQRGPFHGDPCGRSGKHEALGAAFIGYLVSRDDIQRIDIQTQRRIGDAQRRPDVYVTARDSTDGRHVLIVENKIDALEGENQLRDYMRLLEEQEKSAVSRTLVYITRSSRPDFGEESDHVDFKHIYWFEVYGWTRNWIENPENKCASSGELVSELLSLMEDWKMGGEITADDLRAAVTYHTSLDCGARLHVDIVDQAWRESEIELGQKDGRWSYKLSDECWQYSPTIVRWGVNIGMGYWFDRSDPTWDVERVGLPSAAVVIYQQANPLPESLPPRPEKWMKGPVEAMGGWDLWVRTLDETPLWGASLSEHYRKFFLDAFTELRDALDLG